jgi:hypothetical protein
MVPLFEFGLRVQSDPALNPDGIKLIDWPQILSSSTYLPIVLTLCRHIRTALKYSLRM